MVSLPLLPLLLLPSLGHTGRRMMAIRGHRGMELTKRPSLVTILTIQYYWGAEKSVPGQTLVLHSQGWRFHQKGPLAFAFALIV